MRSTKERKLLHWFIMYTNVKSFRIKNSFCLWTSFLVFCVASSTLSKHTIDHRSISLNLNYQLCFFSLCFLLVPILVRWSYKKEEVVKYENQRRRFYPKKNIYSFFFARKFPSRFSYSRSRFTLDKTFNLHFVKISFLLFSAKFYFHVDFLHRYWKIRCKSSRYFSLSDISTTYIPTVYIIFLALTIH